jgi:phage terminase small subunit
VKKQADMKKDLLNILANSNKDIDNQQLMDYLSGNLSGEPLHDVERTMADNAFLNDAVEGLQQMGNRKNLQAYVDELNVALQKTVAKKKQRRLKRRLKDNPWIYLTIVLVIALCVIAYWIIRIALLKK